MYHRQSLLPFVLSAMLFFSVSSAGAYAASFNITSYTSFLNASTQNQQFTIDIGANGTSAGFNIDWLNLSLYPSSGLAYVPNSNSTTASGSFFVVDSAPGILGPGVVTLSWRNQSNVSIIPINNVRQFRVNFSTPLSTAPLYIELYALYENGIGQKGLPGAFVTMVAPPINAVVNIRSPPNGSTYQSNSVVINFNVTGDEPSYACVPFVKQNGTSPFQPAQGPPNFNVPNNTNTNMTMFVPNGVWNFNIKCAPKNSYTATRTTNGYNVTRGVLPSTLNSVKVGDIVNFVNNMSGGINITFQPPMSQPFSIVLGSGAGSAVDTSPDFSNPSSPKPPPMGPFVDNVTDQFNNSVMGGFGQSGDPRFAPGVFASLNLTLIINGTSGAFTDPGQAFNSSLGFVFGSGPCSPNAPSPKPAFCFPNTSSGAAFNPDNPSFFSENPSFNMIGFTDCTRTENSDKPDCRLILNPFAEITGDSTRPNLLFTKIGSFSDSVFVDFGTDEMTNMTLTYYGGDQYCGTEVKTIIDEGVRFPNGTLIQNSRFKPFHHFEMGARAGPNMTIIPNSTYYYRTYTCDRSGNCISSDSCRSFNSSTTSFASSPIGLNFTIPSGFNFKMKFPNGSEVTMGSSQSFANMTNVTMRFQPTGANWGIDLPASSIATASSFDFSSGFKSVSTGGKTLVGMNKTVWDSLAQRLGVTSINITIIGTSDTLVKCDDNGENCNDVTPLGSKLSTNISAGTSTWSIPVTLGFSTYTDTAPVQSSSPSTSSSGGGGSGGSAVSGTVTPGPTEIKYISAAPGANTVSFADSAQHDISSIVVDLSSASGLQLSVKKFNSRPIGLTEDVPGAVYDYLEISQNGALTTNIVSATIRFQVNRSWVESYGIDPSTISLSRYSDGSWEELPTIGVGSGALFYSFEAESPGFSTFAITGAALPSEPEQEVAPPVQVVEETPEDTISGPQQAPAASSGNNWVFVAVGAVAVVGLAIFFMNPKNRKKKRASN